MNNAKRLDLKTIQTLNAEELLSLRGGATTIGVVGGFINKSEVIITNRKYYPRPPGGGTPTGAAPAGGGGAGGDWRSLTGLNAFYPGEEGGNGSK